MRRKVFFFPSTSAVDVFSPCLVCCCLDVHGAPETCRESTLHSGSNHPYLVLSNRDSQTRVPYIHITGSRTKKKLYGGEPVMMRRVSTDEVTYTRLLVQVRKCNYMTARSQAGMMNPSIRHAHCLGKGLSFFFRPRIALFALSSLFISPPLVRTGALGKEPGRDQINKIK